MKVGFIGCGNMGGALSSAVSMAEIPNKEIFLCDTNTEKRDALAKKIGANVVDLDAVTQQCDFIFLGVKPAGLCSLLSQMKEVGLPKATVLISMAAGITIDTISEILPDVPIVRIMPNTPVSVGKGVILYSTKNVDSNSEGIFLSLLKNAGQAFKFPESLIDAGTALSGCGPAFCYMFIEALADGAVECGIPRAEAINMAALTLIGSAEMVLTSGEHPEKLKDNVCSPGGSTITGVHALEDGCFRGAVIDCVNKAYKKTKELSK